MSDSRTGTRFPLILPIRLDDQAHSAVIVGNTDNVSAAGVHISLDADIAVGSDVQFEVTIPAAVIGAPQDVIVRCQGRVVRNDSLAQEEHKPGVACVIDTYEFIRTGEK